jgi:hypothetical protein
MASLITLSSLTLNPQEAQSASEAIFEALYAKPELNDAHFVATGIQMKTQIPLFGQFGIVGKKAAGSCDVNAETKTITPSQKYWDPMLISFRLIHCQEEIDQLFKMWKRSKSGLKTWEDMPDEQVAFLMERILDATMQSVLRISSLASTTENTVGAGGHLTNGTTITYFTMLEGLWKQIWTAVAGGTLTARTTITANLAPTYAGQDSLADDAALTIMREMYEKIDARARLNQNLVYQLTDSLFKNWQTFLENKSLAYTLERTEAGKAGQYTYRGIPIVVRYDWDRLIRTYFDSGAAWYLPHRAILTPLTNVPIGTSDQNDLNNLDLFYSRDDKKHYSDVAYYLDCKLLEEYMIAVAY